MSQGETRNTKELFRAWRLGDAEAGGVMAQRFADWYYAIATSRLGEAQGAGPCRAACERFGSEIINVKESRALIGWAHGLILDEIEKIGGRATDGDEANTYTGNQRPKALLSRCRGALPEEVALLEACYGGAETAEIERMAAPLGGNPLGVLKARYSVKRWMRDNAGVPFEVAPDQPILDRAPLPLFESGRMATPEEEINFEQWMISDLDLCRDIAEFAVFSIALRGGIPADAPTGPVEQMSFADDEEEAIEKKPGGGMAIGLLVAGIGVAGLFLVLAVIAGYFLFM